MRIHFQTMCCISMFYPRIYFIWRSSIGRFRANRLFVCAVYSPLTPAHMDWSTHFPAFTNPDPMQTNLADARKLLKDVEVVDIGCGFGGLLVGLAPVLPDTLMVGMFLPWSKHDITP